MIAGLFLRLFARYSARHLEIALPGFALRDGRGRIIGHLDQVALRGGRLAVSGWTLAARVMLVAGEGAEVSARPHVPRPDVAGSLGIDANVGFDLDIPYPLEFSMLVLQLGDAGGVEREVVTPLPSLTQYRIRLARLRLLPGFLLRLLRITPDALRWKIRRDPLARARIKTALGLDTQSVAGPLDHHLFDAGGALAVAPLSPDQRITMILPVYNAFSLLPEVLERLERHTALPWHLIVIEDCSTDTAVRPFLQAWAAPRPQVELIENPQNLGFIGSVNKGLARAAEIGDPVVLLNSDAFLPAGWAERLIRPMIFDAKVATVTPMSNDAEIFSVPVICARTVLQPGEAEEIDKVAQRFSPDLVLPVVPTGVGFCMALNPAFLGPVPALDTVFGRGYGEEVDWCQKVRALGGTHLGLPGLFVEHRGGESFGSEAKLKLVQANNAIVSSRYPGYDLEVQEFIQADPLLTARVALALAFAASRAGDRPVPIHLAHSLGGGAEKYLERRLKAEIETIGVAVVLRVGGPQRWRIEVHSAGGISSGTTDSFAFVQQLLEPLTARHLIYGCGVGDPDPLELPACLLALKRTNRDRIEVLFHDFFPISPSYCLLDGNGHYLGPVAPGLAAGHDAAHTSRRQDGRVVRLADWQAEWGALIAAAETITVFSDDSRHKVLAAWPDAEARVTLAPHTMLTAVPRIERVVPVSGRPQVIGVLGNIGRQKGASVVVDLGRVLEGDPLRKLVLVGNIDPAFALPASVHLHGNYHPEDIPALVERYGIDCWLIPSIWPETFSFTTHEALATGMPVYCFDLGAQGDAVGQAANGRLIPFAPGSDLAAAVLDTVASAGQSFPAQ